MIYVFMGKSSVGKDYIVKKVLENNDVKLAVSHTTRPIRNGETDGVEYYFIDKNDFLHKKKNNYFIETRLYNTYDKNGKEDIWYYGLSYDALNNYEKDDYIAILDLKGLNDLIAKLGDEYIEVIYIVANRDIRMQRALNREGKMTDSQIKEVERRFVADDLDFPDDLIENIDMYILSNNNLDELNVNLKLLNKIIKTNKQ